MAPGERGAIRFGSGAPHARIALDEASRGVTRASGGSAEQAGAGRISAAVALVASPARGGGFGEE